MYYLKQVERAKMLKWQLVTGFLLCDDSCITTITFDRGKEFSKWSEIENKSSVNVEIYFGDPVSPVQRGLNENPNGIVRKDLPKSTDLYVYSQEELNTIAYKWNSIPRKSLNYQTPNEIIKKQLVLKAYFQLLSES